MTKFLFYTDFHLAGESPRHRVDNFPRALIEKQKEIYEIAEKEGCDFVAFGGDWFNNHRIFSYDIISDSMDIICNSKLKTYMVIGEHDLYGHNIDTLRTSTLAFYIKRCDGNIEIIWEPKRVAGIVLHGKHETDDMHEAMARKKDDSDVNVMLCHELITCNTAPFEMIKTDTLQTSGWDLVMSGDLHDGYPTHEVKGTWFCNPGSLARRATSDAWRKPQVAIVSIEKGSQPNIEIRQLKCGREGKDVFGLSIAEIIKAEDIDASKFTDELLKFEAESTDIHDLVQKTGKQAGLRLEVLNYLQEKRNVV